MKKILIVGAVIGVVVLALGAVGFVYAQTQTPPTPEYPAYGPGMMGGRGGMLGGYRSGGEGPMHQYMIDAFAEALGLTPPELESRLEAGETMWQIAESQGLSQEEFGNLWLEARTAALNQAVAAGLISQEMADWMIERMAQRQADGFGPGRGGCMGGGGYGSFRYGFRGQRNP